MSNFLAETRSTGLLTPAASDQHGKLNERERDLFKRALSDPNALYALVPEFFAWLVSILEVSGLQIPISQVPGFVQQVPLQSKDNAAGTTTSTTYTDLTGPAVGPQLTGLPDGTYLLGFGAIARNATAGGNALMSFKVNATEASDDDASFIENATDVPIVHFLAKTISGGGNNTLTLRYRVGGSGGTGVFQRRWILAIKMQNA